MLSELPLSGYLVVLNSTSPMLFSLKELEFIKHCRSLDIPLTDVKRLMELKNKPEESCASVNKLIAQQLALVNNRMRELKALKAELQQMASLCTTENTIEACGIIKSLDS